MGMDEILAVREWLNDCKVLSPSEVHSFNNIIIQNNDIIQNIFTVLEDRNKNPEVLEGICGQLFSFYQSRDCELQRFVLQYLPAMISVYLSCLAQGDRKTVKCIEVLLLGIYNLEVVDLTGKPKIHSFRLPSVAQPSVYHVPLSLASASLTENSLSRLDKGDTQVIAIGPFPQVEKLNAQNRMKVMTVLMNVYNKNLSYMRKLALHVLCKMCSRLVKLGFGKPNSHHRSSFGSDSIVTSLYSRPSRVPLTSSFLLEVLHGVYFSMFNGLGSVGLQALDDVHHRASKDLMAEVLLVTNGVRNSIHANPSGQPNDGPMGISVSISPTTSMTTVHKSIITNASFRTRKLPDDIPIQSSKEGDSSEGQKSLATICEETEDGNDKIRQSIKGKEKEKGKAPLIGMISKIGGSRGKDKSDKGIGSGTIMASNNSATSNLSTGMDVRRKDSDTIVSTKTSRRDSDSCMKTGIHNGDHAGSVKEVFRTDVIVVTKNPPRNQAMDSVEMKNLKLSGTRLSGVTMEHLKSVMGDGTVDTHSYTGNISSAHSSQGEEIGPFNAVNQNSVEKSITISNTQIHTTV